MACPSRRAGEGGECASCKAGWCIKTWPGEEGIGGVTIDKCRGCWNDDWIDNPESKLERSSGLDPSRLSRTRSSACSSLATAAATPSSTARSLSGRSKICEEFGWRMYLCCRHAGWMNSPKGGVGSVMFASMLEPEQQNFDSPS